jgi:hypothetical protein
MIVLRMCPTCICLATFGAEKSITTVRFSSTSPTPSRSSPSNASSVPASASDSTEKLMNPAPATVGVPHNPPVSTTPAICSASARGFIFITFASTIAAFV